MIVYCFGNYLVFRFINATDQTCDEASFTLYGLKRLQVSVRRRSLALIEKELRFLKNERNAIERYSVSPKFAMHVLVTVIVRNDVQLLDLLHDLAVHALVENDVSGEYCRHV